MESWFEKNGPTVTIISLRTRGTATETVQQPYDRGTRRREIVELHSQKNSERQIIADDDDPDVLHPRPDTAVVVSGSPRKTINGRATARERDTRAEREPALVWNNMIAVIPGDS